LEKDKLIVWRMTTKPAHTCLGDRKSHFSRRRWRHFSKIQNHWRHVYPWFY